jgi:hypothetical protein
LSIEIEKGPEYQRVNEVINLPPGKLALRFELTRLIDPSQDRWYAGALVKTPLSPHDMLLEGSAEGLRIVDLLAYERESALDGRDHWKSRSDPYVRTKPASGVADHGGERGGETETLIDHPNLLAFSGQHPCLESPACIVACNTLNSHSALGSLALLNCHRIVFPLRFGRSGNERSAYHRPDNWALADWCDQCHRKGGVVIGLDLRWWADAQHSWSSGEGLADLILGKIDGVGMRHHIAGDADWWYTLLSLGLRAPIVDADMFRPVGCDRTYARMEPGQNCSYATWIEAIRAGRTVVSSGPYLTLQVNGMDPGAVVDLAGPSAAVAIEIVVQSRDELDQLELIHDGKVVMAERVRHSGIWHAKLTAEFAITHSGWLAARCTGERMEAGHRYVRAHTSPVYVRVDQRPPPVDPDAVRTVSELLGRTMAWVENEADCPTSKDRERLADVFLEAKQVLARKLQP